jgi:hypothetical protein
MNFSAPNNRAEFRNSVTRSHGSGLNKEISLLSQFKSQTQLSLFISRAIMYVYCAHARAKFTGERSKHSAGTAKSGLDEPVSVLSEHLPYNSEE